MQKSQKGFTLIELVVVIVLLGILGVTALAKFQDLSLEAQNAANSGIASELSSSSSINYAAAILGVAGATAINTTTETCIGVAGALFATGIPTGYQILPAGNNDCTTLVSFTCTVDNIANTSDTPVTSTILCTP
ncbi:MAG: type II secretion system protein [Gammaproteobacteria bacterium]